MSEENNRGSEIVFSTEHGRMCPKCGNPLNNCSCRKKKQLPAGDGRVRIYLERKGRKGKGVTVITGFQLDDDKLKSLAKQLKQRCGTGGTVKHNTIEIQGDFRDIVLQELTKQGYKAKRAGG
ncbi:MAG: translation initiation factor Sui1 [Fibrobacterota bacterium]